MITDLNPLLKLKYLPELTINYTQIPDLTLLEKFIMLEELNIIGANFENKEIKTLKLKLPHCKIKVDFDTT